MFFFGPDNPMFLPAAIVLTQGATLAWFRLNAASNQPNHPLVSFEPGWEQRKN
jgi:hypothetical protein